MDAKTALARARLVAVLAALAGLAVMHGLPAMQACAQAGTGFAAMATPAMPGEHAGSMAAPTAVERPTANVGLRGADMYAHGAAGEMHGVPCAATPPSLGLAGLLALVALGLLAIITPTSPRPLVAARRGPRRRAPPRFGSLILYELCVSRT
ncbi:hypothetical protein I6A60_33735 [Frankia sp. AgB1.9]|uniref:hypothetical protein n=1 Tax=unclassified Frankia TaxID=2632575 RepID=UPI0019325474|nr:MULTISPECIES: hypothetical protein [unclassified Frankia]MBL7493733.1 hypothetical protein [Frankia sp. AgW1.1]MBL7552783.1 hypothetical protein [Frankia sp. AgB1.9]MBL7625411.1 hypothetical protein [Frankia sp. AgB1.8]